MRAWNPSVLVCLAVVGLIGSTTQGLEIETVPVGNPGNPGELSGSSAGGYGPDRICGSVNYRYEIGKYEVTAGQYTEFLNAVAGTDTYGLYNTHMDAAVDSFGCNIIRTGFPGNYTYSVASDWAKRPVTFVSWGDAVRFANWLTNGRPMGTQDTDTTEDGSYCLNGAMSEASLLAVVRKPTAAWVVPSEDEWYKAAHYKGGSTDAGYWDYASRSNTAPGQDVADASGNNANYSTDPFAWPIGSPYYTTVVGTFQNSPSPFGTFDQGGNVWEWNEAVLDGSKRSLRGGSFINTVNDLHAAARSSRNPTDEDCTVGFRVVELPELGDFDGNRHVDSADIERFKACFSGPDIPCSQDCIRTDLDADGDVDQADFGVFQQHVGEGLPKQPQMVVVPAGAFHMGDSLNDGHPDQLPVHAVYLDAFDMDQTEVTNQQYADALNWALAQGDLITVSSGVVYKYKNQYSYAYCSTTSARKGNPHYGQDSQIAWDGTTFVALRSKASHPMLCVSWYGAIAYANWRSAMQGKPLCYDLSTWECNFGNGYRLPTEAEWEKAARGGAEGRRFPWSDADTIQHTRANYRSTSDYVYDTSSTRSYHPEFSGGDYPYTSPVSYFTPNGYGLYDMAGNVCEWTNDRYSGGYYGDSPYKNPHGPTSGSRRAIHGGACNTDADDCRIANRFCYYPYERCGHVGFRLVLNAD